MRKIGAFEAKTYLPALLQEVLQGETIEITRRGVPVARLVPIVGENKMEDAAAAVRRIREARKGTKLGKLRIRELIDEGR
jgi:prevent-host-death family protein